MGGSAALLAPAALPGRISQVINRKGTKLHMTTAKDLTKEAPRSPRIRIGDYALMGRMIDKGRATLNGTVGEYHFACPLDQQLFTYKGVVADDVKAVWHLELTMTRSWRGSANMALRKASMKSKLGRTQSKRHVRTRIQKAKNGLLENAQRSDLIRLRPPSSIISKPTIA